MALRHEAVAARQRTRAEHPHIFEQGGGQVLGAVGIAEGGIQIKGAKIPAGKHIVRISVADTQGARSIKEIEFEVL